jgi:hypothetical protein
VVIGIAEEVVNSGQVEVHLAAEFWFEVLRLQIDHHVGS